MRKQYVYYINGIEMSRKEFMNKLKMDSQTVVKTIGCGEFTVGFCEYNEKLFRHYMYEINKGVIVFINNKNYRRKEK